MINFYELLGVNKKATKKEITVAYEKRIKKYHFSEETEEVKEIIKNYTDAKDTLLDNDKRKAYDLTLNEINHAKQFAYEKEETYNYKMDSYKENYDDYFSGFNYYLLYLKYGIDNFFLKIIKSILVLINFLIFMVIKGITFGLVYLLNVIGNFVDYFAGFIMIMAIIMLFMDSAPELHVIPFLPNKIECFCVYSIIAFAMEMAKIFILEKSLNLYVFFQNVENWLLVRILMTDLLHKN